MACRQMIAFAAGSAVVSSMELRGAANMQPDVVAHALAGVEDEWVAQASLFIECSGSASGESDSLVDCHAAPKAFEKSYGTVVNAMLQGSGGDKEAVNEYLNDVCGQSSMQGWRAEQCHSLGKALDSVMSGSDYENRVNLKIGNLCTSFWGKFLDGEKQRLAKDQTQHEQEAKAEESKVEVEKVSADAEAKKEEVKVEEQQVQEKAVNATVEVDPKEVANATEQVVVQNQTIDVNKNVSAFLQRQSHPVKDPCGGIKCGSLSCPGGFTKETVPGHCCPYCVNPNINLDVVKGATGTHGGKTSAICKDVWCFPTMCANPVTSATTTNGQCCDKCA